MRLQPMSFRPYGATVIQSWEQVGNYLRAIDKQRVDLFVEIGYCVGGLASLIVPRCVFVPEFKYLGIENDERYIMRARLIHHPKATYITGDCFSESFADTLRTAIAASGRTMLLCDGGDKPKELAYFKDFLGLTDLIAVHDYMDEVTDDDLAVLGEGWRELEPDRYREALAPVFERIG